MLFALKVINLSCFFSHESIVKSLAKSQNEKGNNKTREMLKGTCSKWNFYDLFVILQFYVNLYINIIKKHEVTDMSEGNECEAVPKSLISHTWVMLHLIYICTIFSDRNRAHYTIKQ